MANTFFTSDTHFGHANIIKLCDRPFTSVEEMDETMIERWNARVGAGDVVFHLGDFALGAKTGRRVFERLNGTKVLIRGNHDDNDTCRLAWGSCVDYVMQRYEGQAWMVLFHYPILEWDGHYRGNIHLHGHQHNKSPLRDVRRVDVGVDANDFTPWALEEIRALVA